MCRLSRKGKVPWKEGHREQVILLEDEVDKKAGKEVAEYLGFRVLGAQIKLADLKTGQLHLNDVLVIIVARASQIRTYQERKEKVPSFKEFITKRNEKKKEKSTAKSGG